MLLRRLALLPRRVVMPMQRVFTTTELHVLYLPDRPSLARKNVGSFWAALALQTQ